MVKKRLFFDIETSYMIVKTFNIGQKVHLDYKSIIQPGKIICICYKWEHEKKVHFLSWDSKQDDKRMLQAFIKIADTATELVGHNGDNFDTKWIRTRCLKHGISMFPDYQTIDTLKQARQGFRLPSNRLDAIGSYLEVGNKIKTDLGLWDAIILHKCSKALKKMIRYCQQDVKLLERVFIKFMPYTKAKVHYGVINGGDKRDCPECGHSGARKVRKYVSATGVKRQQLQCFGCHKHYTIKGA